MTGLQGADVGDSFFHVLIKYAELLESKKNCSNLDIVIIGIQQHP